MEAHDERTRILAARVKSFHDRKEPFRIYHGGTTSTRRTVYHRDRIVDTGSFGHVLDVDLTRRRALVEPNVNMGKLVDATLPHGLVPTVVPEFTTITVGGCFAGTGGESSSFIHGLFEDSIARIEIVLADGRIMSASEDENADLFQAAAGSYGTLGVLTALEVKLVPSKPYVAMTYHPVTDAASAVRKIEELTLDTSIQYLDGILYGPQTGVILSGRFEDKPSGRRKAYTFHKSTDEWFYLHVRKRMTKHAKAHKHTSQTKGSGSSGSSDEMTTEHDALVDLVPTRDYLFRYDRAGFWVAEYAFRYFYIHRRRFQRWLLSSFCKTTTMMHATHKSGLMNQHIVQDISLPYTSIPEFVDFLDQEAGIWPLWVCPLKLSSMPLFAKDPAITERILNIGVWGRGDKKLERFVEQGRRIERKTQELHGLHCLYAQCFRTNDEFWEVYDKGQYEAVREKYSAQSLPDVYAKVGKNSAIEELKKRQSSKKEMRKGRIKDVWIFRGLYGAASMLVGRDYLMSKR